MLVFYKKNFQNKPGKMRDMTQGSPAKLILQFGFPLFIGLMFQQVYSMVDTMIAGRYIGESAIAAIGASSAVYSLLINFSSGLNNGYGLIVARFFGEGDREKLKKSIACMLVLNIFMAVILTAAALLVIRPLMHLLQTPEEVFGQALKYIMVIVGGLAATIFYNMCAGLLRAVGNSVIPLVFLVFSSVLNIALDALFVICFHSDVSGVAAATVIAQGVSTLLCGAFILKNYKEILPQKIHFKIDRTIRKEMVTTGFSMGLMMSVFDIGSILLQGAINALGMEILAAHTAARRLLVLFMQPQGALSAAAATYVSQNWGAGKTERIKKGMKDVFLMETVWSAAAWGLVLLFGQAMIRLTTGTDNPLILDNAWMNLQINLPLFIPLGILVSLRTCMQGMGCKIAPVVSSLLELLIKIAAAFFVVPLWGYFGASLAEPSTWVVCVLFLIVVFGVKRKELLCQKIKKK